jgi:hypothetical protein
VDGEAVPEGVPDGDALALCDGCPSWTAPTDCAADDCVADADAAGDG